MRWILVLVCVAGCSSQAISVAPCSSAGDECALSYYDWLIDATARIGDVTLVAICPGEKIASMPDADSCLHIDRGGRFVRSVGSSVAWDASDPNRITVKIDARSNDGFWSVAMTGENFHR